MAEAAFGSLCTAQSSDLYLRLWHEWQREARGGRWRDHRGPALPTRVDRRYLPTAARTGTRQLVTALLAMHQVSSIAVALRGRTRSRGLHHVTGDHGLILPQPRPLVTMRESTPWRRASGHARPGSSPTARAGDETKATTSCAPAPSPKGATSPPPPRSVPTRPAGGTLAVRKPSRTDGVMPGALHAQERCIQGRHVARRRGFHQGDALRRLG